MLKTKFWLGNLEQKCRMLEMKYELNLPVLPNFISGRGYELICCIRNILKEDNKKLLKVLKKLCKFTNLSENITVSRNNEIIKLIKILKEESSILFDIASEKCDYDYHKFLNVLPKITAENSSEIIESLYKIKKYSNSNFLDFFSRLHHVKLRKAILDNKNKKELYLIIKRTNERIAKANETRVRNERIQHEQRMLETLRLESETLKLKETIKTYRTKTKLYSQASKIKIPNFKIVKDSIEADFWGAETHCCLKKGGAASELLIPIETSPIAGELVGKIKDSKVMIYFWDMIEINNSIPQKTLILDNLEASKPISFEDFKNFINKITSYNLYNKIYLGTLRNDIDYDLTNCFPIVSRQFSYLSGYRDLGKGFNIADSYKLYLLKENNDEEKFYLRKMNKADLFLTKYIEDYVYDYNNVYTKTTDESDYIYQSKLDSPCYILDNSKTVLGYIITRYRYYDQYNKEILMSSIPENYSSKKLYIEDIVFTKNKEALNSINMIIADFVNYCNNNQIKEVYCDTNVNSKNMKKRLEKMGIKLIDHFQNITLNPINKLGLYNGEIKIENKLK